MTYAPHGLLGILSPRRYFPLGFLFAGSLVSSPLQQRRYFFMSNNQKSTALYPHPFSRAYWRDAAAELRDTHMLVFAALMIALRLVMKQVSICSNSDIASTSSRKRCSKLLSV